MILTEAQTDILNSLRAMPTIVRALLTGLDPNLAMRAKPGEWSIATLVAHLADVDELMIARMERLLAEPDAIIAGYDPGGAVTAKRLDNLGLGTALERFVDSRARYLALLDVMPAGAWSRSVVHESDGVFTVELFTARIVHHDIAHLEQMVQAME